jgi:hypothetical protein
MLGKFDTHKCSRLNSNSMTSMEKLVETAKAIYTKKMETADYGLLINSRSGGNNMISIVIELRLRSCETDPDTTSALTREILRIIRSQSGSHVESYVIDVKQRTQCCWIPWPTRRGHIYTLHALIHSDSISPHPRPRHSKPI